MICSQTLQLSIAIAIVYQDVFNKMKRESNNVTSNEGIPSKETLDTFANGTHKAILMDGLMAQVFKMKRWNGCSPRVHITRNWR